jgi:hypothetical protein
MFKNAGIFRTKQQASNKAAKICNKTEKICNEKRNSLNLTLRSKIATKYL